MNKILAMKATIQNLPPDDASHQNQEESGVAVKEKRQLRRPHHYKVLIHNDDYTTMDFVVLVLKKCFGKSQEEAMQIMLNVHQQGMGICGIYTYEVAETKCQKVMVFARQNGHPLKCTIEKE